MQGVTAGSDLHVIVAAQHLSAVQQAAGGGEVVSSGEQAGGGSGAAAAAVAAARAACLGAHRVRYGPITDELAWRLVEHNRNLYL